MLVQIAKLIDDAKCFETVRRLRWPEGVTCPHCQSHSVAKDGRDDTKWSGSATTATAAIAASMT